MGQSVTLPEYPCLARLADRVYPVPATFRPTPGPDRRVNMTTEHRPQTSDPGFEEWVNSIDWDAIDDQNRIEGIGSTLHELAADLEALGYAGTVATVAGIMDGFTAHRLSIGDDAKKVAAGFSKAMVRAAANALTHPEEEK